MISSVSSAQSPLKQFLQAQINQAVNVASQNQLANNTVSKATENEKTEKNTVEPTETHEGNGGTQALMNQLSQVESQYLSTSSVGSQTNQQVNQVNGLQAYQQAGKTQFSFA